MIDELEFWGVDSSSGKANAEALAAAEQSEPATLPEIVRDVQAAGHCAECGKSLANHKTITLHEGKPYCSCCFNPGAGS